MSESVMATPFVRVGWVRASNFLMSGVAALLVVTQAIGEPLQRQLHLLFSVSAT